MSNEDIKRLLVQCANFIEPYDDGGNKAAQLMIGLDKAIAEVKIDVVLAPVMPRRLTAENGAKALLIGEFHETIVCHDEEGEPYEVKMPVEWHTIKEIYKKIVAHYEE